MGNVISTADLTTATIVVPVEAGTDSSVAQTIAPWVSGFAGMTENRRLLLDFIHEIIR
jgi:hypothetical protein